MDPLIYLVHRIPYPPNKGDKIRSYHWLRFLATHYRVHLGTFVDDVDDWQYVETLKDICEDVCAVELSPKRQRLKSLAGFATGEPLCLPYYRSEELERWVERKIRTDGISRIMVFSSSMAQYAKSHGDGLKSVIDFVDVDSEKWRQYSERRRWPFSWIYRREGERLLAYEKDIAEWAAASVFVTEEEASVFRERAPNLTGEVRSIINGVDSEFFSPERGYENPFEDDGPKIVFTGMMDYWANVDAVEWFAREALPRVQERHPTATFVIVGARPSRAVQRLSALPRVCVTGRVPDVRPFLAHSDVVVAPIRIARGIQNKVLEALAMARPVVATSAAMEGLDIPEILRKNIADESDGLARRVSTILDRTAPLQGELGHTARDWVLRHHDWAQTSKPLAELIA